MREVEARGRDALLSPLLFIDTKLEDILLYRAVLQTNR